MKEEIFTGYLGASLNTYIWDDVKNPIAAIQIIHGLNEYLGLYDEFAELLNANGFIVFGADCRRMGKSAVYSKDISIKTLFSDTVEDNIMLGAEFRTRYALPLFVFGHGYGSMVALRYIELASDDINGVFLSSPAPPDKYVELGSALSSRFGGKDSDNAAAIAYAKRLNKRFTAEGERAWMSQNKEYIARIINDPLCNTDLPKGFLWNLKKDLKLSANDKNVSTIRKDLPVILMAGGADPSGRFGKNITKLHEMFRDAALTNVKARIYQGVRHALAQNNEKTEIVRDISETVNEVLGVDSVRDIDKTVE